MRRPREIAALKASDFMDLGGEVVIRIWSSKTDQLRRGKEIPIDRGGKVETCPVRLGREWIRFSRLSGEQLLFPNISTGEHSTTAAVSKVVKVMAENAGLKGKFIGHSLRIGGATAAMKGRMSLAMIKSIGG